MSVKSGEVGFRSDGDYDYKIYWLQCDCCGRTKFYDKDILSFTEVVELKKTIAKSEGWTCKKYANGWADICPNCNN